MKATPNSKMLGKCLLLSTTLSMFLYFSPVLIQGQKTDSPNRGLNVGGSYSLGEIETIDTVNGNLSLRIPLATLPTGRGGSGFGLSLKYNSKLWDSYAETLFFPNGNASSLAENVLIPAHGGGWGYAFKYNLQLENRLQHFTGEMPQCSTPSGCRPDLRSKYIYKLSVVYPDGSQHEFRPLGFTDYLRDGYFNVSPSGHTINIAHGCLNGGYTDIVIDDHGRIQTEPEPVNSCSCSCAVNTGQITTGMVYYSIDGSFTRLEVDYDSDGDWSNNAWTLYFPNGSQIVNSNGIQKHYDRNGNFTEIRQGTYNGNPATEIVDQLGRSIFIQTDSDPLVDHIYSHGFNNEELKVTVKWKLIQVNRTYISTTNTFPATIRQLGELTRVVDEIILPEQTGGLKYKFGYNADNSENTSLGWGEVNHIELPSGATVDYQYLEDSNNPTNKKSKIILLNYPVRKDLHYTTDYDGQSESVTETWLYNIGTSTSEITNPDGGITKQYFYTLNETQSAWNRGLVYKTENPDGSIVERIWEQNITPGLPAVFTAINPFVRMEAVSVRDANGTLVKTAIKEYNYDKNGNSTQTKEYDWVAYNNVHDANGNLIGTGDAPLKRTTRTAYHYPTPDALTSNGSSYIYIYPTSRKLYGLPQYIEVRDIYDVVAARSEFEYDSVEQTGNLTLQRTWDSTRGAYTDPNNYISVSSTYNSYRMPLTTTDARGTVSQITYGNITGPNGTITDLYPTEIKTAYNTSVQKTARMEYDFYTGAVKKAIDVDNNVWKTTTFDVFGRPTLVKAAEGTVIETRTATEYNDASRRVIVRSDLNTTGDGKLVSIQHYDQLGRVRLTRTLEDSTTQSPYNESDGIKTQTRYLYNGNFSYVLSSNPYRAATSSAAMNEPTMGWSRSKTNNKGQTIEIETFSGASLPAPLGSNSNSTGVVLTDYDANITIVTDQSDKRRKSEINALGQLVKVTEDPSITVYTGLDYETIYTYDTLSNLTQVNQGIQTRTFAYSSLSRLLMTTNPESGTVSYSYDAGGNLLTKQDARNIKTSYSYDQLSRALTRSYQLCPQGQSCQSEGTPTVTYTYDDSNVPFGIGKLTKVSSSVSETSYTSFDALGKLLSSKQRTDGTDYTTSYSYNIAGGLVSQTYPSGRVVTNSFDNDGRLTNVSSKADSTATPRTYANAFTYNAAGAVSSIRLGNGRYESTQFNSRLQPTQIALGTSATNTSLLKLEYNYGSNNNNGNVQSQTITVPGMSHPLVQAYTYDALNRLLSATETSNSTQTWKETFSFDRYGNRMFDTSNNNTTTLPENFDSNIYNPTFNTANNRMDDEQGYEYDSAGNVTKDATGKRFSYDGENKQTSFGTGGSSTNGGTYFYDGDGKRVKKIVGEETTIFVYNASGQMVAEYTTTVPTNPTISYLTSDTLGTPRINTDANGQVTARHDYMPFGEEIISGQPYSGGRTNQLGYVGDNVNQQFLGKERDGETGLDYFWARYYSSAQGRFMSPDPLMASARTLNPQTWNRFVYVLNNPLRYIDPDGMKDKDAWSQLTKEEQKIITSKLNLQKVSDGKGGTRTETSQEAFNRIIGGGSAEEIEASVITVKNFIDSAGGRSNSEIWKEIKSIDKAYSGANNTAFLAFTVNNRAEFLKVLGRNGFDVDAYYEYAKWFTSEGMHQHSARFVTENSQQVGMHIVQENNQSEGSFFVHWDKRSSAFKTWDSNNYKGGLVRIPYTPLLVYISGKDQERIDAGKSHYNPYTAKETRQKLKDQGIVPKNVP